MSREVDPWQVLPVLYRALHAAYWGCKVDPTAPAAYMRLSHRLRRQMVEAMEGVPPSLSHVEVQEGRPVLVSPEPRVEALRAAARALADNSMPMGGEAVIVRARDLAALRAATIGLFRVEDDSVA